MSAPAIKLRPETLRRVDAMLRLSTALSKLEDALHDYCERSKENDDAARKADRDGR